MPTKWIKIIFVNVYSKTANRYQNDWRAKRQQLKEQAFIWRVNETSVENHESERMQLNPTSCKLKSFSLIDLW